MNNNESADGYKIEFSSFLWMEICGLVGLDLKDVEPSESGGLMRQVLVNSMAQEVRDRIDYLASTGTPVSYLRMVRNTTANVIEFKQAI